MVRAHQQLVKFVGELIAEGAGAGEVRGDVPTAELAQYCLHALTAANSQTTGAAVRRLVAITLDGLRPAARQT